MPSLYLLIPIALIFCGIAIKLLLWAINNGQYDDLDKEAWRILSDGDETISGRSEKAQKRPPPETPIDDNDT
ncbi:MAG: cbb3-type cytochrome oxidase assembly protein CcoS [Halioglobus sp.]